MTLHFPRSTRRASRCFASLGVAFFLLLIFGHFKFLARSYDTWTWTACPGLSPFDSSCTASRAVLGPDVQVVVKTGGSEAQSRLEAQLATLLLKIPAQNILIFSDLKEHIGEREIHDVYADLSKPERATYPEFALYDAQQAFQRQGKDTRELQGGWDLAKYMNLAMKRKLWAMQQTTDGAYLAKRKWFVFIDTDTFIDWDNLLELLEHLDSTEKMYLGSPVWLPGLQFAHGGSAYVLSSGALEALNDPGPQGSHLHKRFFHSQYGLNVTGMCCGDEALARVLQAKGIKLQGYWPMFNGETPATVAFGNEHWCEPVISLHHLAGEDMISVWRWIEEWKARTKHSDPLLFKDLYSYVAAHIADIREDWDNSSDEMKVSPRNKKSHASFENCKAACEGDGSCFQFVHDGHACSLSRAIQLGKKRLPDKSGTQRYMSGWNVERIREWIARNNCTSAHWVAPNP